MVDTHEMYIAWNNMQRFHILLDVDFIDFTQLNNILLLSGIQ